MSRDQPEPLTPGAVVGNYEIVRLIGRGGMGAVYEAQHVLLKKPVALKVLLGQYASDEVIVRRFMQEGQAASRIGHEGIVDVSDVGLHEGTPYLVMELLQGESLADRLDRERRLDPTLVADVLAPVCAALAAAHTAGVIHRDLKPDNIFLTRNRRGLLVPKLVDFGISKVLTEGPEDLSLTKTGTLVGTPNYMAPEQAAGRHAVDERADQYAVGVILYECLAGRVPFPGDNFLSVVYAINNQPLVSLRKYVPELPEAYESVVFRALARDPDVRFARISALGAALLQFASPVVQESWGHDLRQVADEDTAVLRRPSLGVGIQTMIYPEGVPPVLVPGVVPVVVSPPAPPSSPPAPGSRPPPPPPLVGVPDLRHRPTVASTTFTAPPRITMPVATSFAFKPRQDTDGGSDTTESDQPDVPWIHTPPVVRVERGRVAEEVLGPYRSGVRPLTGLDAPRLQKLAEVGVVDLSARAHAGPPAREFLRFMQRWSQVTAHGYTASSRPDDRAVTLEGLECELHTVPEPVRAALRAEFAKLCHDADELRDEGDRLFAWWG